MTKSLIKRRMWPCILGDDDFSREKWRREGRLSNVTKVGGSS
jgi:hypothetical protein